MSYYRIYPMIGLLLLLIACRPPQTTDEIAFDVVVIGGGTGGTAAGIQAARSGARTLIVEPSTWLGGMLTAAGVSAIDGNHHMPAGIWGEFRDSLRAHYGGAAALATGWVSHTQFEPHVGAAIFQRMAAAEEQLTVWFSSHLLAVQREDNTWWLQFDHNGGEVHVKAQILIDGTDLGDVAAQAGATFDLGMEAREETGEAMAPAQALDIVQDLTYAAILKDYGEGADKTIPRPATYDSTLFFCACRRPECPQTEDIHACSTMINYARLPNNKYMINWPRHGNDYYANVAPLGPAARDSIYEQAKAKTLSFVYYLQTELGYAHLGLADDEFPTEDRLPFLPYHREGRRIHGIVRLDVNDIMAPYRQPEALYRTGIAVGDYPIDHHHAEHPEAPEIDFPPVPSFAIPLGALIPAQVDHLLLADKAISVTNIANGSTRLQPVILQIGQAAGLLAAMAVAHGISPREVPIRAVQTELLTANGYLVPSYDVSPAHPFFEAIQRMGVTGLLRGAGEPYQWANRTWFYPDSTMYWREIRLGTQDWPDNWKPSSWPADTQEVTVAGWAEVFRQADVLKRDFTDTATLQEHLHNNWSAWELDNWQPDRPLSRAEVAVITDRLLNPFTKISVDFSGYMDQRE